MPFTEQELEDVASKRKVPRPSLYNAERDAEYEISEDLEAFLILASGSLKLQCIGMLNTYLDNLNSSGNRADLLKEMIEHEKYITSKTQEQVSNIISSYEKFYNGLQLSTGFSEPEEIYSLVNILESFVGPSLEVKNSAQYRETLVGLLEQDSFGESRSKQEREARSWINIFLAY